MQITKVTLEITKNGWRVDVFDSEDLVSSREHEMVNSGMSQAKEKGDIWDDTERFLTIYPEAEQLIEGIDSLSGFDIASEMMNLE